MPLPALNPNRLPQPGQEALAHFGESVEVFISYFDADGVLDAPNKSAGNFRVSKGTTIELVALNGSQPLPVVGCIAESPLGKEERLPQRTAEFGTLVFAFKAELAGPYRIQLQYGPAPCPKRTNHTGDADACARSPASVVIVEPSLSINGVPLKQESISVQTVLSRCLGPFSGWRRMFTQTGELGYNVIHFTPLQALGESGSCYSIADQLHISEFFLDDRSLKSRHLEACGDAAGAGLPEPVMPLRRADSSEVVGLEELRAIIHMMETDLGLLSTIDLVLNHTASNSPWLRDHPDSGYSPTNSPWLCSAYELDWKIQEFSQRVVRGEFRDKYGATKDINDEGQLQNVMRAFDEELLKPFRMEEWFLLHIDNTVQAWIDALAAGGPEGEEQSLNDGEMHERLFNEALKLVGIKRGATIVIPGSVLRNLFPRSQEDRLRRLLGGVNSRLLEKAHESANFVRQAVEGHARWERLQCRRGPLGLKHWEALAPRYFTPLNEEEPDVTKRTVLANNGWVMGWDATKDFAAAGALVYLRRELVVWSDCVKLRYGTGPEDSPFLWNHMTEYCRIAAKAFHGVRLDNCHSTPIHVAQHMLRECRRIRPDFWVFAELFTGSQAMDLHFERCLGINALVREAMQTHDAWDLVNHLKKFGMQHGLGQLSPVAALDRNEAALATEVGSARHKTPKNGAAHAAEHAKREDDAGASLGAPDHMAKLESPTSVSECRGVPLRPAVCPALFYDCTHDNETPSQKFTPGAALPLAVLLASAGCAVGSTRGYDELVPRTLSVVAEDRRYEDYHGEVPLLNPLDLVAGKAPSPSHKMNATEGKKANGAAHAPARKLPEEIKLAWTHGGGHVVVRGSWDGWQQDVEGTRDERGQFQVVLRKGVHYARGGNADQETPERLEFKFIVDGNWTVNADLPRERVGGNENNVLSTDGSSLDGSGNPGDSLPGILSIRPIMNAMHVKAGQEGFNQLAAECKSDDLVVAVRHHPQTHECIYFIARCAYQWQQGDPPLPEIQLSGKIKEVPLMATLFVPGDARDRFQPAASRINGLPGAARVFSDLSHFAPNTHFDGASNTTCLRLQNFPRGSALIVCTAPGSAFLDASAVALARERNPLFTPAAAPHSALRFHASQLYPRLREVSLTAMSELLYSCDQEERDRGSGTYNVAGYGQLVYAGLCGPAALLDQVRVLAFERQTDHPFFRNLQQGFWLLRYSVDRIAPECLKPLKQWLQEAVDIVEHQFPVYDWLRPFYADAILSHAYATCCRFVVDQMPLTQPGRAGSGGGSAKRGEGDARAETQAADAVVDGVSNEACRKNGVAAKKEKARADCGDRGLLETCSSVGDRLLAELSVATLQMYSFVPSAPLVWGTQQPSIAAGLPFFSSGFMRAWGRDTFIALRGILLATGRYDAAKAEILGFARVMRHGLIPNLLDAGNNPRYNARDATWFFCQAIQDYCLCAPDGLQILKTPVEMKYESNATQVPDLPIKTLADVIHHILLSHAKGIDFREWNAGRQIDEHMRDEGFNVRVFMDPSNGLIFGGNRFNCGTWMDKMGSSDKAGNRGLPATPRDGAAIEIIGLLKSTLRFVTRLPEEFFPYKTVTTSSGQEMTYVRWNSLLDARVEKCFYVPKEPHQDSEYFVDGTFINRRGIYKDTYKATEAWRDYQLRPNACVALAVAPELFDRTHAREYLEAVEKALWGPNQLGLKTLDPSDWNYRPDYDNANDSNDFHVAHGYNYHQGPEWVWPLGYFLRAKMIFAEEFDKEPGRGGKSAGPTKRASFRVQEDCMRFLQTHRKHLETDKWKSLPELTNSSGSFCKDSCQAQAWSVATLLAFLSDLVSEPADPRKVGLKASPNAVDDA
ncbi:putative glycogen debranching enzyme [Neospora caninum Liverpool]|uniref:Glycogen debranching enzyme n=1 Tax=Neospora caninum (strain Liverpool) TaxID=572307 RepID=F0VLQ0_NEOCL|nr:putative glycogen debranching enzyme [Neospora caninum Liverpool]CBZ54178.1 putative glycogen debranching enzyme [Neospora caninum Liverpool]CEL68879.1 TPA: glycogen debranching enzyme, putative [Neospora caninum Liverpool]|eukprot:XP_003884209.1 putative glycogen debranching enzyme [Neospora caninum Liverpool]